MCGWSYVPLSPLITDQHSRNRGGTHSQTRVSGDGEDSCRLENGVRWSALVTLVSVRARYGLCNERIEYCVPLARAGTQYNATTCSARAGLILVPFFVGISTVYLLRTRGVDPYQTSNRNHVVGPAPHARVDPESSPRVRSGLQCIQRIPTPPGNISACAERTNTRPSRHGIIWDHLRVCGADGVGSSRGLTQLGSSPRVRSGLAACVAWCRRRGIISACAERTCRASERPSRNRDHLRVCGADLLNGSVLESDMGSSPRVRSGRDAREVVRRVIGIISACAERTRRRSRPVGRWWDHLRVCGADHALSSESSLMQGSSPRVRSGPGERAHRILLSGIISACAERTPTVMPGPAGPRDHLRVCGADNVGDRYSGP